jgi:MFS family permease
MTKDSKSISASAETDIPSLKSSYTVAAMLAVVYTLNFLDRQFLSILAEPVRRELHFSDTQLGELTGLTFALFYTAFGIPVAAMADRWHRVRIIAAACTIWSLFSATCGLATNFATLALARIGVGIGEAGGSPPSYSVISDYFPPEKRATGLAIYSLGVPFGLMIGAFSGGRIAEAYGWRVAFFVVGGVGLLLVPLLLLLVKEPQRGRFDVIPVEPLTPIDEKPSSFNTILLFVTTPKLMFTGLSAGLTSFVGYALLVFTPSLLIRDKGMTLHDVANYYSIMLGISVGFGTWVSGVIVDKLGTKRPMAYALVPGAAILLSLPFVAVLAYVQSWQWALVLLIIPSALNIMYLAPALAVVQNAVKSERRGTVGALLLFLLNLIGLGGGPTFVGAMSDHFKALGDPHSLTSAVIWLWPFFILTFLCQLASAWFIHKDRRANL